MKRVFRALKSWSNLALVVATLIVGGMIWVFVDQVFLDPPMQSRIEVSDDLVRAGEAIQMEILNGCGVDGVAMDILNYMRARGFDVVEIGNYTSFEIERSQVVDRVGDSISAAKVAYALGIADSCIVTDIDSTLVLRNSVIIGRDYGQLKPYQP